MHDGRGKGAAAQVHIVALRQLQHPLPADAPVQQTGEEQPPQHRQALLIPAAQLLGVAPLGPLRVQLGMELFQHARQLHGVDGLQNIFRHVHLDGLLGVLKVVKAGKHHEFGRRQPARQDAAKLQAVHKGHLDIREHHVGLEGLGQLQGVPPVFRLAHQGEPQARPVHLLADAYPDVLLVVHQQHPVQFHAVHFLSRSITHLSPLWNPKKGAHPVRALDWTGKFTS